MNEPLEIGSARSQSGNETSSSQHSLQEHSPQEHSKIRLSEADLSEIAKDCAKEQYRQRRQEIEGYVKRIEDDIRNSVLLTGGIWSWLAVNYNKLENLGLFENVIIFMPAVLVGFLTRRFWVMNHIIDTNATFLRELERKVPLGDLGWEYWLKKERAKENSKLSSQAKLYKFWWILLIIANLVLAASWILTPLVQQCTAN